MLLLVALSFLYGDAVFASLADDYLDAVIQKSLESEILSMNLDPAPLPDFGDTVFASLADDYLDAVIQKSLESEILSMNLDPAPLPDFGDAVFASLADDYLDAVIQKPLEREILSMNLDPAPLPDFGIPFTYELGLIPISGRVDFSNGLFNGLSKVQRLSQCEGPTMNLKEVKLECIMRFFGFSVVYDVKATIDPLPPIPFQVTGYINETLVKSAISGAPASLTAKLNLLEITKFGDINVRPSNLGLFQYIYNAVEEELREEIRKETVRIILYQFPMAFGKALTFVKLPGLVQK